MKKFGKIISVNLLLLCVVLIFLEFFCYLFAMIDLHKMVGPSNKQHRTLYNYRIKLYNYDVYFDKLIRHSFKCFGGEKSKKKPIVVMGCSYAFGQGLKEKQTFCYKLSKKANRPVINWSIGGGCIQHGIIIFQDTNIPDGIKEPEYVIFVYNSLLHIPRLYYHFYSSSMVNYVYPSFIKVDNHLKRRKDELFSGFYLKKMIEKIKIYNIENKKYNDENWQFVLMHFLTLQEEIHKRWQNTKLVVLFYDQFEDDNIKAFDEKLIAELQKNGIIVVRTKDLTGKYLTEGYFISENDIHPNEKAWDEVVPKLVVKMKL